MTCELNGSEVIGFTVAKAVAPESPHYVCVPLGKDCKIQELLAFPTRGTQISVTGGMQSECPAVMVVLSKTLNSSL
jgi:hypothetical protein